MIFMKKVEMKNFLSCMCFCGIEMDNIDWGWYEYREMSCCCEFRYVIILNVQFWKSCISKPRWQLYVDLFASMNMNIFVDLTLYMPGNLSSNMLLRPSYPLGLLSLLRSSLTRLSLWHLLRHLLRGLLLLSTHDSITKIHRSS